MEHRIQGAYTALDMDALYKAYGRVLKTRVSLQNERRQLEMSGVNSVRGACPPPHPILLPSRLLFLCDPSNPLTAGGLLVERSWRRQTHTNPHATKIAKSLTSREREHSKDSRDKREREETSLLIYALLISTWLWRGKWRAGRRRPFFKRSVC